MKKTRVWPALLAALVILAGCAAAPPEESDPPTEEFVFTRENMPRLNGSTSAVPLAEAVCSVLLGESREEVADLVQFSRTTASYEALMAGEADLLLAGEPEQAVMERLEAGDRWLLTPFATDALVFVVNADNPVNGLTTEQLQKIYTGEITNWKQVGGSDLDIVAFQRNPGAGSQTLMEKLVMDGKEHVSTAALCPDLPVLTFNGLSKSHMICGFRCGWLAVSGPREVTKDFIAGMVALTSMRLCGNALTQLVIPAALQDEQSTRELLIPGGRLYEQREAAVQAIRRFDCLSVVKNTAAFYIFPRIDLKKCPITDDKKFAMDLLHEKHILLVPGSGFDAPDYVRWSYATSLENIKEGMDRLEKFLATLTD